MFFFRTFSELKYLAYYDSLTGILNRNWLYKNLNNIHYKYVYFIDIINLREVNKLGHSSGDEYIKLVVQLISSVLKENDIFVRYAGDEFIVFSNTENLIQTDKFITVGSTNCSFAGYINRYNNNLSCIQEADSNMIKQKLN